jgi:hypothetical protein
MTLLPATIPYLADSVEYFLGKRVRRFTVSPVMTPSSGCQDDLRAALDEQFARIHARCLEHLQATGEIPLLLFRKRDAVSRPSPSRPGNARQGRSSRPGADGCVDGLAMCGVLNGETPAVDVDGQVYACHALLGSVQAPSSVLLRRSLASLRLGSITSPDLLTRLAGLPAGDHDDGGSLEPFRNKQRKYSSYGRCRECHFLASCMMCPYAIGRIEDNDDPQRVPDFYCAFNQVALKYRERFPSGPGALQLVKNPEIMYQKMQPWLDLAAALRETRDGSCLLF